MNTAIWTGAVSNDWTNPDNWSEGIVPDQDTDVIVNSDYSEIFIPEEVVITSLTVENYSAYISLGGDLICGEKLELLTGAGEIHTNGNSIFCFEAYISDGFTVDITDGEFVCSGLYVRYLENLSSSGTKDSVFSFNSSSKLIISLGQTFNKLSNYQEPASEYWEQWGMILATAGAGIMTHTMIEEFSNIVPLFPNTVLQGKCFLMNILNSKMCFTSLSLEPDLILQAHVPEAVNELYLMTVDNEDTPYPSCVEVGECFISGQEGNLFNLLGSFVGQEEKVAWTIEKDTGIIEATYTNLANSTTVGDAIFKALTRNGNVDGGNNEGWIFSETTVFSSIEITERTTESVKATVEILEYDPVTSKTPQILSLQGMLKTYNLEQYSGRVPFVVNYAKPDAEYRFDLLSELEETPDMLEMVSMTEPYWSDGTSFVTDQIYFNPIYTGGYELVLFENNIEVDRVQISVEGGVF